MAGLFGGNMKQCRWLHDWGQWNKIGVDDAMDGEKRIGIVLRQERICARCGYVQTEVKTHFA